MVTGGAWATRHGAACDVPRHMWPGPGFDAPSPAPMWATTGIDGWCGSGTDVAGQPCADVAGQVPRRARPRASLRGCGPAAGRADQCPSVPPAGKGWRDLVAHRKLIESAKSEASGPDHAGDSSGPRLHRHICTATSATSAPRPMPQLHRDLCHICTATCAKSAPRPVPHLHRTRKRRLVEVGAQSNLPSVCCTASRSCNHCTQHCNVQ